MFDLIKLFIVRRDFKLTIFDANDISNTVDRLEKRIDEATLFKKEWLLVKKEYEKYLISFI